MNLTRNGVIVLISVIFVAGAGTAYAEVIPTAVRAMIVDMSIVFVIDLES